VLIDILIDNKNSWIWHYKDKLRSLNAFGELRFYSSSEYLDKGDVLLLLSCNKILPLELLSLHKYNIVIHESDLPKGRGWSPVSYQVEKGIMDIPVTLFEANQELDTGKWYIKSTIKLNGTELIDEIREKQFNVTLSMIKKFLTGSKEGNNQFGDETYYAKRSEDNQQLDISKSIENQFDKLRVCDNNRYPSHFSIRNQKYILKIYKKEDNV
jgi:methionyl-tRNA formyltransferase